MNGTFGNLQVCSLTEEQHRNTCGYWYTVTSGVYAHTAFATERGLLRWLQERGLELAEPLPARGTFSWQFIQGAYSQASTMDEEAFAALSGERITVLDNGDYTVGVVTRDEAGHRTVHHLNCNVKSRQVFDHAQARKELN